jgi:hypothetical protein
VFKGSCRKQQERGQGLKKDGLSEKARRVLVSLLALSPGEQQAVILAAFDVQDQEAKATESYRLVAELERVEGELKAAKEQREKAVLHVTRLECDAANLRRRVTLEQDKEKEKQEGVQ